MTEQDPVLEKVTRSLGYVESWLVEGRTSVADLFPPKKRCGVYILEFTNGEVYGGRAVDVTRRYVQHRQTHADIRRLHFLEVPECDQSRFEPEVIRALEASGLPTRNIEFASKVLGETDLDVVMPVEAQKRFEDEVGFNDASGTRTRDDALRRKLNPRYAQYTRRPHAAKVTSVFRAYIPVCVPAFIRTELSFWALSLPPRPPAAYARVNVGWQEVVTAFEEDDGALWFSFHVAASPLGLYNRGQVEWDQFAQSKGVHLDKHTYTPGGPDQLRVFAQAEASGALLADEAFLRAARLLNLRLMRKRATTYGKFHSFALADAALGGHSDTVTTAWRPSSSRPRP